MMAIGQHRSIYICAKDLLVREALAVLFAGTAFDVVASGPDLESVTAHLAEAAPVDLVLFYTSVNDSDEASLAAVRSIDPATCMVLLLDEFDPELVAACFQADMDCVLFNEVSRGRLLASLDLVLAGERFFPAEFFALVGGDALPKPKTRGDAGGADGFDLTDRGFKVLRCLVEGQSNKEIASNLEFSVQTAKIEVKKVLKKLNCVNRTQAAVKAVRLGII